MTRIAPNGAPIGATPAAAESPEAKLRKAAKQMEGAFVLELYKAMRSTVPQGEGVVDGGSGEETFTSLMDQHLATETPPGWSHGLGDAIYRHLARGLGAAGSPALAGGAPTLPPALPSSALPLAPALPSADR